jgi:Domain of unknown function (DUF4136)
MQEFHLSRPQYYPLGRCLSLALILLAALALPVRAKTSVDFDPDVDFSKFKTFAFIGPVQNLVEIQLNADLINTRMHDMVVRELGKKGLREVNLGQNPDLVVRYWAVPESQVNVAAMGNWAPYSAYIDGRWSSMYNTTPASNKRETTMILDLIQAKTKSLTWRVYMTRKLSDPDKDWKKAEEEFTEGFKSYPPPDKEKAGKHK